MESLRAPNESNQNPLPHVQCQQSQSFNFINPDFISLCPGTNAQVSQPSTSALVSELAQANASAVANFMKNFQMFPRPSLGLPLDINTQCPVPSVSRAETDNDDDRKEARREKKRRCEQKRRANINTCIDDIYAIALEIYGEEDTRKEICDKLHFVRDKLEIWRDILSEDEGLKVRFLSHLQRQHCQNESEGQESKVEEKESVLQNLNEPTSSKSGSSLLPGCPLAGKRNSLQLNPSTMTLIKIRKEECRENVDSGLELSESLKSADCPRRESESQSHHRRIERTSRRNSFLIEDILSSTNESFESFSLPRLEIATPERSRSMACNERSNRLAMPMTSTPVVPPSGRGDGC